MVRRRVLVPAQQVVPPTVEEMLAGLNPEQRQVVEHVDGPLLVGAVAGAGKTKALTTRIARLVRSAGVAGARILAVTFSKKAADEMNQRLELLCPGSDARVGTAHSLAFQWMQEEVPGFRRDMVDDKNRFELCVKDAVSNRSLRNQRGEEVGRGLDWLEADQTYLRSYIGLCKATARRAGTPEALAFAEELYKKLPARSREPGKVAGVYKLAERLRLDRQLVTFDDMLLEMCVRLNADEAMRARWAARWDYVLQDEGQDENPVQREILTMLAEGHRNYMLVGDPAQTLYGFRGADPTGMLRFPETWDGARVVLMHRNYRCGASIAAAANGVLSAMPGETRLQGEGGEYLAITAERRESGTVEVQEYEDADDEAEGFALRFQQLHADGLAWRDIAVLYRVNSLSRALEEACLSARIPYVVVGGTNFYLRKEVALLLCYLRVAAGRGDVQDVGRSLNAPFRFLGKQFVDKVEQAASMLSSREGSVDWASLVRGVAGRAGIQRRQQAAVEDWAELIDGLRRRVAASKAEGAGEDAKAAAKPAALLEQLIRDACTPDGLDYVRWLTRDEGTESPENNRLSNVRELVRSAERFVSVDEFLDYVDQQVEQASRPAEEGDRVVLMSIHRSKGLEFRAVFLAGCVERILPHAKAEDQNEERRLAYVAITRAKDYFHAGCPTKAAVGTKVVELEPSRFLEEAKLEVRGRRGNHDSTRVESVAADAA